MQMWFVLVLNLTEFLMGRNQEVVCSGNKMVCRFPKAEGCQPTFKALFKCIGFSHSDALFLFREGMCVKPVRQIQKGGVGSLTKKQL